MNSTQPTGSLLHPRHWPSWILLGLLRLVVFLPYPTILRIGAIIGNLLRLTVAYRRKVAITNLALCFPDLTQQERVTLLKKSFEALGISMLEMALCWWATDKKLASLGNISGLENLQRALQDGNGVILLTGHFTAFEIAGRLLVQHIPMCVTYREFRNPVFHHAMVHARKKRFKQAIHRYDVRTMIQALRDNNIVWYAADQDPGVKNSVFASFFGIASSTLTTTSRLARITGANVVPFFVKRLEDNGGYEITIDPALSNFPSDELEADANTVNTLLENQIRLAPEQYYWVHRRFKTRPQGEPGLYTQKPRRKKQQELSNSKH